MKQQPLYEVVSMKHDKGFNPVWLVAGIDGNDCSMELDLDNFINVVDTGAHSAMPMVGNGRYQGTLRCIFPCFIESGHAGNTGTTLVLDSV